MFLADKCLFQVISISKSMSSNKKLLSLVKLVKVFVSCIQKCYQRPPDPHLQSTSNHHWLRPWYACLVPLADQNITWAAYGVIHVNAIIAWETIVPTMATFTATNWWQSMANKFKLARETFTEAPHWDEIGSLTISSPCGQKKISNFQVRKESWDKTMFYFHKGGRNKG